MVAERFADAQHIFLHHFGIHVSFRPEGFEDFVVSDQAVGVLDEIAQHIEGFRSERQALFSTPETLVDRIEPECVEELHCAEGRSTPRVST